MFEGEETKSHILLSIFYNSTRRSGRHAFVAVVIFFAVANLASGQSLKAGIPLHHFDVSCDNCHESGAANSPSGQIKADINRQCTLTGCHVFEPPLNHPVGVVAKVDLPANMPLDRDSRITCLTCHDDTRSSQVTGNMNANKERMLRLPAGSRFCSTCHSKSGYSLVEQSHWRFSANAHLGSINPGSQASYNIEQSIGGIDTESRTCLSCHDDITPGIPQEDGGGLQKFARWRNMSDHPIGVDYQRAAMQQLNGYRFPLMTGEGIRLFDGKLGCGSCHSLYATRNKSFLVVRSQGGVLCRRCHNK